MADFGTWGKRLQAKSTLLAAGSRPSLGQLNAQREQQRSEQHVQLQRNRPASLLSLCNRERRTPLTEALRAAAPATEPQPDIPLAKSSGSSGPIRLIGAERPFPPTAPGTLTNAAAAASLCSTAAPIAAAPDRGILPVSAVASSAAAVPSATSPAASANATSSAATATAKASRTPAAFGTAAARDTPGTAAATSATTPGAVALSRFKREAWNTNGMAIVNNHTAPHHGSSEVDGVTFVCKREMREAESNGAVTCMTCHGIAILEMPERS